MIDAKVEVTRDSVERVLGSALSRAAPVMKVFAESETSAGFRVPQNNVVGLFIPVIESFEPYFLYVPVYI